MNSVNDTPKYFELDSPDNCSGRLDKAWIRAARQRWGCKTCRSIHLGPEPWSLDVDIAERLGPKTDIGPTGKSGLALISTRLQESLRLYFPEAWGTCWLVSKQGKFSAPDTVVLNPGERSFVDTWFGVGSQYKRCAECGTMRVPTYIEGSRIAIEDIRDSRPVYVTWTGTFVVREDIWNSDFKRFLLRKRKLVLFSKIKDPPDIKN